MKLRDLAGKNICILGYGKEGKAMAQVLSEECPDAKLTIADKNSDLAPENPTHGRQLGKEWLDDLSRFDVVIKSPGIPHAVLAGKAVKILTTPTQIFFDSIRDSGARTVGITGSKGKSTTSSLIHAMLKAGGKKTVLIGNIGEPAILHLKDAIPDTIFVIELSSYQLMDLSVSPDIAVITSFFPEHLDYHGSLEAYRKAKENITKYQRKTDVALFPEGYAEAERIALVSLGKAQSFSASGVPLKEDEMLLKGEHNRRNAAAALAVARLLGVPDETSFAVLRSFKGLPHRLETVALRDGVEWVNDSISTTPESAIAALDALGSRVSIIILGGQDRGYDFSILAKRLTSSHVKTVILLPESGEAIRGAIMKAGADIKLISASTMPEAVTMAKSDTEKRATRNQKTKSTPVVLLSPASPSYGHFKNFEDRGEQFRNCIVS